MKIAVSPNGWGLAQPANIEALLKDTAFHMNRLLRSPFAGTIHVIPSPSNTPYPKIYYRRSPADPFIIQLSARDRKWDQFAFQFSHEFCHVLSGYERLRNNPNNWFHEVICELASVFTLRRMAERWPIQPPYPNWRNYSESLADYAEARLSREEVHLPVGTTLREWLSEREEMLRRDPYQRELNEMAAYSLLSLFESHPTGWNAMLNLPGSLTSLADYLHEWRDGVEHEDRAFMNLLVNMFE